MHQAYGMTSAHAHNTSYDLAMTLYSDATVYPADLRSIPLHGRYGILDQTGKPVRRASLERWSRTILLSPQPPADEIVPHLDEEVIFAGYISHHYGHFLLESLSRLWAYKNSPLRIVWAGGQYFEPWSPEIFLMLGIDPDRHLILREPLRFSKIWVPTPGYIIPRMFHHHQKDALATVECVKGTEKVYLSRHTFHSPIYNVGGEDRLEERLRSYGWRIVHPETLPVADQVRLFATSRAIAGIEGSALHTAVLCKDMKARLINLRRPDPNRNYDTIARTAEIEQDDLRGQLRPDPADPKRAAFADPEATAELVQALSEE